jgi:hypothetical protein
MGAGVNDDENNDEKRSLPPFTGRRFCAMVTRLGWRVSGF